MEKFNKNATIVEGNEMIVIQKFKNQNAIKQFSVRPKKKIIHTFTTQMTHKTHKRTHPTSKQKHTPTQIHTDFMRR